MGKDEQKGIEQEAAVADHPEELGAGLEPDEVTESLKGMREAPAEVAAEAGEGGIDDSAAR